MTTRSSNATAATVLAAAMLAVTLPHTPGVASQQPTRAATPADREARTMNAGRWEGEYTDIEGHRARVELTITRSGPTLAGDFVLALSTEDQAERYTGSVTGTVDGSHVVLRLHARSKADIVCRLSVAEPHAYAEQAVYGIVEPTPALKLGGGVLTAWKFKQ